MKIVNDLLMNDFLVNAFICIVLSQVIKPITGIFEYGKLNVRLAISDGGMPSSHSAVVTSMAVTAYYKYGVASDIFGITVILALIVMHDAKGVRMEAGKHAKALNEIIKIIYDGNSEVIFKELVGHTPTQVVGGAILGIVVVMLRFTLGM